LSKPYYPTPDELQGARPLNEQIWFPKNQAALLRLADTNEGRDLLCLDSWIKRPFRIIFISKNMVTYYMGHWDARYHYLSDVRVGSKWGNVIRYRWREFVEALDRNTLLDIMSWPLIYDRSGKRLLPVGGGTTTTDSPDPNPETDTVDGSVNYLIAGVSGGPWSTLHDASTGTAINPSAVDTYSGPKDADAAGTGWEGMYRTFILFDVRSIDDTDVLDSATIEFTCNAVYNTLGEPQYTTIVASSPASSTDLTTADYDTVGSVHLSDDKAYTAFDSGGTNYNVFTLNSAGKSNVKFDDISKFAVRNVADTDDDEPGHGTAGVGLIAVRNAETSSTSKDPKLVALHSEPVHGNALLMFGVGR